MSYVGLKEPKPRKLWARWNRSGVASRATWTTWLLPGSSIPTGTRSEEPSRLVPWSAPVLVEHLSRPTRVRRGGVPEQRVRVPGRQGGRPGGPRLGHLRRSLAGGEAAGSLHPSSPRLGGGPEVRRDVRDRPGEVHPAPGHRQPAVGDRPRRAGRGQQLARPGLGRLRVRSPRVRRPRAELPRRDPGAGAGGGGVPALRRVRGPRGGPARGRSCPAPPPPGPSVQG